MKKILLGLLGLSLLVPAFAFAADFRAGSLQSLASSHVVEDDLYLFGGTIINSGTVHGDFLSAGGTILVTGNTDGSVQVAGGDISLTGAVGQTVRAAGGSIVITGNVGKDVVAAGGTVDIVGKVGRDVFAAGGAVTINAPITGRVEINAQKVIIGSKAVLSGTLTYRSTTEAQIDPNAKILGEVKYLPLSTPSTKDVRAALIGFLTFWIIAKFLAILVVALLLIWLLKRYVAELVAHAYANPALEFAKGLAAVILFPIISVLLCVTLVGLPLGLLGILGYISLLILSAVIAPLLLGSLAYKWITKGERYEVSWKTAVLGVVAYFILGLIPIVGFLLLFVFIPLAFGVILKIKWNIIKTFR